MRKILKNKKVWAVMALVLLLFSVLFPFFVTGIVYAEENGNKFDEINVLDDLRSAPGFDILNYPYYDNGSPDMFVINVVEYCYSFKINMRENYGLYLYVYNPNAQNIDVNSRANKVQIAVKYDSFPITPDSNPIDYEKFDLQFCSMSTEPNYYRLFYKFKVVDHKSADGKTILERINSSARRYDISGFELHTAGKNNATDYPMTGAHAIMSTDKGYGTFTFSGYAKSYGADPNAESNIACKVGYLESVSLQVQHTFYRTKTSNKGAGYQNQLDTVYFSVPKRLIDTYGKLQRIKAEWYEYKTKDIVVTSNSDFYNAVFPYLGTIIDKYYLQGIPTGSVYNENIGYSLGQEAGKAGDMYMAKWGWNLGNGYLHTNMSDALYLMFKVDNIKEYDPYAAIVNNGGVASNDLYEKIKSYDKTYNNGSLPIKNGTISADNFEEDIDDYRKVNNEFGKIQNGYSYYDFDADVDMQKLSSWQETNPDFWDNWVNWGLWDAIFGNIPQEESKSISPIQILKQGDLDGTNQEVVDRLLINAEDVSRLRDCYNEAINVNPLDPNDEEKVVVLFRYATSDYYAAPVDIIQIGKGFLGADKHTSGQAYRAFESVFFDFDIIQLTFNKDGKYTVIPVVSNPIDIVNGLTPPVDMPGTDWWKLLLMVLALVLVLLLLTPVLPYIIKFVVWVIVLPFRLIGALFKAIIGRKKHKKKE